MKISDGLTLEDAICVPDPSLSAGMKTAPMSEKPAEETGDGSGEMNDSAEAAPAQTEGIPEGMEGSPEGEVPAGEEGVPEGGEAPAGEESTPAEGLLDVVGGQ